MPSPQADRARIARDVARSLELVRYTYTCEEEFQEAVASLLSEQVFQTWKREHRLGASGTVDFFERHLGIAIEAKIKGSYADVLRQLSRYAQSHQVKVLVLATTRNQHAGMPHELHRTPVIVARCFQGAL